MPDPDLEAAIARGLGLIAARKSAATAAGRDSAPASSADLLAGEAAGANIPPTRMPVTGGPEGTLRQGYVRSILQSNNPAAKRALATTGGPEFPADVGGGSVAVPSPVSRGILDKRTPAAAADQHRIGPASPGDFTPESLAAFNRSGKYEDLVRVDKSRGGANRALEEARQAFIAGNATTQQLALINQDEANYVRDYLQVYQGNAITTSKLDQFRRRAKLLYQVERLNRNPLPETVTNASEAVQWLTTEYGFDAETAKETVRQIMQQGANAGAP